MFKTIALVIVVVIVALLIFAMTKPDTFRVQRSTNVNASPDKVFPLINDFRNFGAWSPYEKLDPAMKRTYSATTSGVGAWYGWESDGKAGVGRMEITESSPPSNVIINLDFVKPFATHNIVAFTLDANGDSTDVTWAMHGPSPYIAKVMTIFFNMDHMVGKDFEAGLASLKAIAEK